MRAYNALQCIKEIDFIKSNIIDRIISNNMNYSRDDLIELEELENTREYCLDILDRAIERGEESKSEGCINSEGKVITMEMLDYDIYLATGVDYFIKKLPKY